MTQTAAAPLAPETPPSFKPARVVLEDGTAFDGRAFGADSPSSGEVVFNTGMVGYPEALTDPSYHGQILAFTFPLVGNYGVPCAGRGAAEPTVESDRIQVFGLVVSDYSAEFSHWSAGESLHAWLARCGVPGICGVDTRSLTRHLRERGAMLGRIDIDGDRTDLYDPNSHRLAPHVSIADPQVTGDGRHRVVVLDCGCKNSIVDNLVKRGVQVRRVPWDTDLGAEEYDGLVISSGPGDPKMCGKTVQNVRAALNRPEPVFGICLGHQIMALAVGADTYKLKYGHRSQNQPVRNLETGSCSITSQNHGFAVDASSLPDGWESWFENLNDGTNEGIRHESGQYASVQFHPEASPGPVDTRYLFDDFVKRVVAAKK